MIITNGTHRSFPLAVPGVGELKIRAPGLQVTAFSVAPLAAELEAPLAALGATASGVEPVGRYAELDAALRQEEIHEYGTRAVVQANVLAPVEMSHMLVMGDLDEHHVQLDVEAPGADEGVLLMVDDGETPLLFAPSRFEQRSLLEALEWPAVGPLPEAAASLQTPQKLRFVLPARLFSGSPPLEAVSASPLHLGGVIKRAVVRFFKFKLVKALQGAVQHALEWITEKIEKKHKQEGFKDFAHGFPPITSAQLGSRMVAGKRALLLVHGIFSSADGAFGGIVRNVTLRDHLLRAYKGNIFAWDHFTVSKGTLQNASELLTTLPPGLQLDIISHSRGAVVTRCALEHPNLQARRKEKLTSVGKVFFVAGAHRGSALARRANVDKLLNAFSLAGSVAGGVALGVVIAILKVLAHGITDLPGILDMDPDRSEVLKQINAAGMTPVRKYLAVRANFDYATRIGKRLLDMGADAVFREPNDLVVPFGGGAGWDDKVLSAEPTFVSGYGTSNRGQSLVFHNNFFEQPGMVDLLMHELHG